MSAVQASVERKCRTSFELSGTGCVLFMISYLKFNVRGGPTRPLRGIPRDYMTVVSHERKEISTVEQAIRGFMADIAFNT